MTTTTAAVLYCIYHQNSSDTLFMVAVLAGHLEVAQLLVERGALNDPRNSTVRINVLTLLHALLLVVD